MKEVGGPSPPSLPPQSETQILNYCYEAARSASKAKHHMSRKHIFCDAIWIGELLKGSKQITWQFAENPS